MRPFAFVLAFCAAAGAKADAPRVVVDIAPVHSLVAQVMDGAGTPKLIMSPNASPHHYALRPSEASALSNAELVIWMGEGLTPWLLGAIDKLAQDAGQVILLEAETTQLLQMRDGVAFDHDDTHGHAHDEEHAHDGPDPHAWLDPVNAQAWLILIAAELAALDPENATLYHTNAARSGDLLQEIADEIYQELDPVRAVPFVVFHDAYQYFEARFDIHAAAAISLGDAARPGPARLAALRHLVADRGIECVLSEPQFDPKLARSILAADHRNGILDPMGATFEPGTELYPSMLKSLAAGFVACAD